MMVALKIVPFAMQHILELSMQPLLNANVILAILMMALMEFVLIVILLGN